ncbi:MAG TPA: DinB family protein [Pyrinomonadaceae bacterium]
MKFDILHSIEVLESTPATLRSLLGALSEEWTIDRSRNVGSEIQDQQWQPFDVVGHLIHGEETDWVPRARIILEQGENRTFVPFDRFAQFERWRGRSLAELLDEFERLRAVNIETVRSWDLTDDQLDLEGVHPALGEVTLRQLLATWVVHDLNHIRQIVTAMSRRYKNEVGAWREYLSILSP